jgi:hypothetical protein
MRKVSDMSESRDLLNSHFELADAIKEHIGWIRTESLAIGVIIKALNRALTKDEMRALQYAIQRKDAPADPAEEAWYLARIDEERAREDGISVERARALRVVEERLGFYDPNFSFSEINEVEFNRLLAAEELEQERTKP